MQEIFLYVLYVVLGLGVGSFLNVIIYRYHNRTWTKGRSICFSCGRILKWYELVPVFSYLFLKGKCRKCKSSISVQYILVEILSAVLFLGVYLSGVSVLESVVLLFILSLLIIIFVYDLHHKIIPDGVVYSFILVSFLNLFIMYDSLSLGNPNLIELMAGPVLFSPFFVIWYLSKGKWMGLGDAKLALGMGWFLGMSSGITAIVFSFWIGAGLSLLYLLYSSIRKKSYVRSFSELRKIEIPFAPFMIIGFMLVYFFSINLSNFIL